MSLIMNTNDCKCNDSMNMLIEDANLKKKNSDLNREIVKTVSADLMDTEDYGEFILQKKNATDAGIGIQSIIEKYQDLTGFEHSCNETYIPVQKREDLGNAVVLLWKYLTDGLIGKFPGKHFCVIISADLGEYAGITAHYHQLRDGEFILNENLEGYDQPVLYILT